MLVVVGNQRPPLFGRSWLQSMQLHWAALHQLQENTSSSIVAWFSALFNKDVDTIKGYQEITPEQNLCLRRASQ